MRLNSGTLKTTYSQVKIQTQDTQNTDTHTKYTQNTDTPTQNRQNTDAQTQENDI